MNKALVVAYYFPPIATIASMRPLGFCRHLRAEGWTTRVLAADPLTVLPPTPADEELATRIPQGTVVDRVVQRDPIGRMIRIRDQVRRWIAAQSNRRQSAATPGPSAPATTSLKDLTLTHLFQVPDAQRAWHADAVKVGQQGERPDLVYATGGPWTALLVGRSLARHFDVPFVADFRDPWTRNPFHRHHETVRRRSRRLERDVLYAAARIVLNTAPLHQQFANDYPEIADRFVTISNGFDAAEDDPLDGVDDRFDPRGASSPIELCHFGTVYGKRTPMALLAALDRLSQNGALNRTMLRVRFVGAWELENDDPATRLAERLEALGIVTREAPVTHRECLASMRRADVLLVLQADSPLQIPGKLFECVASGRPVVLVGGEGATADLVRRHRLGRCCPNDATAIESLVADLVAGAHPEPLPAEVVDTFNYRRLTAQLARVFDGAVQSRFDAAVAA
jgi:hypothetical protein